MAVPDVIMAIAKAFNEFADGVPATDDVILAMLHYIRREYVDNRCAMNGHVFIRLHESMMLELTVKPECEYVDDNFSLNISDRFICGSFWHLEPGWNGLGDFTRMKFVNPSIFEPATVQGFHNFFKEFKAVAPDLLRRGPCPGAASNDHRAQLAMRQRGASFCSACCLKAAFLGALGHV